MLAPRSNDISLQSGSHVMPTNTPTMASDSNVASCDVNEIWEMFFKQCLHERIQSSEFHDLTIRLYEEQQASGIFLVDALLGCQKTKSIMSDPLIPGYLEDMLLSKRITIAEVLNGLLQRSRYLQHKLPRSPQNSPDLEYVVIMFAARQLLANGGPKQAHQCRNLLHSLLEWVRAITKSEETLLDPHSPQLYDGIGILAIATLQNTEVKTVVQTLQTTLLLKSLSQNLSVFITQWSQTQSQSAAENIDRLISTIKSQPGLEDKKTLLDDKSKDLAQAAHQVDSVASITVLPTRSGMFTFLYSLVFARPISSDILVLNYLQTRYRINLQVDYETLAIDLIVGAFDILAAAGERKESDLTIFALKSFLIDKVPILLMSIVSHMFPPERSEYCISQALTRVDATIFPSPSLGMMSDSAFQDVRRQFLFACTLHSLLRSSSIEGLLGEQPILSQPPDPSTRYVKELLVEQASSDSDRMIQLIDELDKLNGNASAITWSIAEIMRNLCISKDTMTLKTICNAISQHTSALDVMIQFVDPSTFLQPLCELLDTWRYDEDQGEYQPVYEEFASVFLFTMAIVYRFDLSAADIGLSRVSFVAKYLEKCKKTMSAEDMNEDDKARFRTWTMGLHNPESITDAVFSCCTPQEFYLLAPTIFGYTVIAIASKALSPEVMKIPLEYLCEPFLVPSMIGIVEWLLRFGWKSNGQSQNRPSPEQTVVLTMLLKIDNPPVIKNTMHKTVVSIMAAPALKYTEKLVRQYQLKQGQLLQFIASLKSYGTYRKTLTEPSSDVGVLIKSPGSLRNAFRLMLQSFISWATISTVNPIQPPPNYDPHLLHVTLSVIGAQSVLSIMLDEVKAHSTTDTGAPSATLDIMASLITMPTAGSRLGPTDWTHSGPSQRNGCNTLREALSNEYKDAPKTILKNTAHAEAVVRLHRLVETQLAASESDNLVGLDAQAIINLENLAVNEVTVAAAAAAGVSGDQMNFTGTAAVGNTVDLDLGMDLNTSGNLDLDMLGGGNDDDIFGGLDLGNDMNFGDDW